MNHERGEMPIISTVPIVVQLEVIAVKKGMTRKVPMPKLGQNYPSSTVNRLLSSVYRRRLSLIVYCLSSIVCRLPSIVRVLVHVVSIFFRESSKNVAVNFHKYTQLSWKWVLKSFQTASSRLQGNNLRKPQACF